MASAAEREALHHAAQGLLDEGELAIAWTLVIDVVQPDGNRYLAYRAGGGVDGSERPTMWATLGMLEAGATDARDQLRASTFDTPDEDEDLDEDD